MSNGFLQDWVTLDGSGTTPFVQDSSSWLDLAAYSDLTLWLEVRSVVNPGAGNVTLTYETAPTTDDALFRPLATITLTAATSPVLTKLALSSNPAVPLARFVRWKLQGTVAGNWSATFRIFANATRSRSGSAFPGTLPLTGWWRTNYTGSPWGGQPSAGTSASHYLEESTSPPSGGSSIPGYTGAAFDGVNDKLILGGAFSENDLFSNSACTIIALMEADTAAANPGSALFYQANWMMAGYNSRLGLYFSTAGAMFGSYNAVDYNSVSAACATGGPHLIQAVYNGTTMKVRVDSGAFQSITRTVQLNSDTFYVGWNTVSPAKFDGILYEVLTSNQALTDQNLDDIKAYINGRYGLSL